ncbi:helix-turn-helix domain-containing protein [Nitratireductor sp. CAU 1489]|uniref:Helix-turn-helix domain-containing protein n=1 Tax=Nitratireductor arenosus TaxID=2682096 RepID=A0A844QQH8_9HYPH|nr:helix-turn-helix domain-containing protein [Nitratireductor arenosus]MVB00062.1 helix-turn-helix domain-containing protein [Nitratireductor arenosus]
MVDSETQSERGRPTAYRKEYAKQAKKLCERGATDYELADFFEVDTRTIYRWKNTHDDFCHAVKAGKDKADDRVERSLFNRAVGYSFESEKVFQFQGQVVRAATVEHVPPDSGAAFNWLKNRRPEEWRDKRELDHTSSDGTMTPTRVELVAPGHDDSTD